MASLKLAVTPTGTQRGPCLPPISLVRCRCRARAGAHCQPESRHLARDLQAQHSESLAGWHCDGRVWRLRTGSPPWPVAGPGEVPGVPVRGSSRVATVTSSPQLADAPAPSRGACPLKCQCWRQRSSMLRRPMMLPPRAGSLAAGQGASRLWAAARAFSFDHPGGGGSGGLLAIAGLLP